jgi:hypothetical protein
VYLRPPPRVPWQLTGNHWLALPCIHPADGAVYALGFLHRGSRSAIEFAGAPEFVDGAGPPLLKPRLRFGGKDHALEDAPMVWERALGWLPTFTWTRGDLVLRGTIFAPFGRNSDCAGAVYAIAIENRGSAPLEIAVILDGYLGHRQLRVRTPRSFEDAHRVATVEKAIVLGGAAAAGVVSVAIGADTEEVAVERRGESGNGFEITRTVRVEGKEKTQLAFYIAAGPEPDGALASMEVLRRRGWKDLLRDTRDALQALEQTTGHESLDGIINRNLLFAYFFGVGRAVDDAHYYLVRSRAPWHGRGVTVRDWEALTWILPAVQLADAALARELLVRICELHGYAPGRGVHYFDGTMFAPGICLEGIAGYAIAVDRYIRETNDEHIVDEPIVADTLYLSSEDLADRRDRNVPLYSTEILPGGATTPHPFTLHGNAVVAQALEVLRRTLDEETAKNVEDPDAVRAALRRHFVADHEGKQQFAAATDLAGRYGFEDDPVGSALWLPLYEAVERTDSIYRRTVKKGAASSDLARQCARLLGPDSSTMLQWFRRAPLDGGFAAEVVSDDGHARFNGGDASLSGLLAWTAWYAVHALGERP